jgi:chromatin remodeling complex protein RSC6
MGATRQLEEISMPTKTREKKASAGKTNALQKPLQPSEELAAVVGSDPLPRGKVVSKMWEYIRSHILQTRRTAAKSWPTTSSGGSSARTR